MSDPTVHPAVPTDGGGAVPGRAGRSGLGATASQHGEADRVAGDRVGRDADRLAGDRVAGEASHVTGDPTARTEPPRAVAVPAASSAPGGAVREATAGRPALRLETASVGYGGGSVLSELSLTVPRGAFVGIVGPSGSGKTTLLRLLTGRAEHHLGDLEVLGRRLPRHGAPAGVGYVPQLEGIDWDFPLTVEQVVLLGDTANSRRVPWFSREERRRARALLERLGLGGLGARHIRELSGGQRQRMFLARALLRRCELLLLDEPTSGVDLATRRDVLELLGELHHHGLTVVLTTHDLNFVAAHLPRVVCLNGVITADGPPDEVLTPEALQRTYGAPMRVLHQDGRVVVVDAEAVTLHDAEAHAASSADRPSTDRPSVDRPSADRPSADRPSAGRPSAGRVPVDRSSAGRDGRGPSA